MVTRGVTAVLFVSESFVTLAEAVARTRGVADLPMLELPHPFGVRDRAEVLALAGRKAQEVEALVAR